MELREFAEQVLFATRLEDKLQPPPGPLTDLQPGPARDTPPVPGRPEHLQFKGLNDRTNEFPGLQHLDRPLERGRLLHFFANHELLATELMALVLLRFPEAPAAFRRGVVQTLKDEQDHTRLYLERMRQCGVAFGELPVSGYFWRAVSPMANPIDYVAGLSLTFEQANLDFCRQFAAGFSAVGDADTSRLLERIYRDEIAHVAYGLKWFRHWKDARFSDWEAYCRQLKFPLSPQRAKGVVLNVEGRQAAGLDDTFIAELNVYSQSKGRTPGVYWFNPLSEARLSRGPGFTPVRHQAALARDLANLPQFLCRQDDVVLVPHRPSVAFLSHLKNVGFSLPEFIEIEGAQRNQRLAELAERRLGHLRPWTWGDDAVDLFSPLFPAVTGATSSPERCFHLGIAEIFSKAWSADQWRRFLSKEGPPIPGAGLEGAQGDWLSGPDEVGVAARNLDEVLAVVDRIRARGHHRVVVKEAFGLAGQHAIRLWEPQILDHQLAWIRAATATGHPVVVEPWLERVLDFSVQFEMTDTQLQLRGYTGLINDARGQFLANWAAPDFGKRPPGPVFQFLKEPKDVGWRVVRLYESIREFLEPQLRERGYHGPLGIDAFIYRTPEGGHRLKPIVEINPRYTMGRLTLELMKHVCPGSTGAFQILSLRTIQGMGWRDFGIFAEEWERRHPTRTEGEPVARVREGGVCLNDPSQAQACLAVWHVADRWEALPWLGIPTLTLALSRGERESD
ncbi:MAG: DUF455 family protein [Verrucomicrobiales bacterium]|nr:DUF455 family protein [Verrucomicrobiales bacterium]